jgi:hypothetical protein
MGESLFYSWLRHVKECQVVQTNWKPSPSWQLHCEDKMQRFMDTTGCHFRDNYAYEIYKRNSFSQLLAQAEVDAIGICMADGGVEVYAVDVAFHENGLNYGDRKETVSRVVMKLNRTALCMVGYFRVEKGEVIFASPKIHKSVIRDLEPCVADLNALFLKNGFSLTARVIANDDFNDLVLRPILFASDGVSDTSELFMRGYQLIKMFIESPQQQQKQANAMCGRSIQRDALSEIKIGKIVQTLLREALEMGNVDEQEVSCLMTKDYSKTVFGIDFPLLVPAENEFDSVRYYTKPLTINGKPYRLCSQWFEVDTNNDRPFLMKWLIEHEGDVTRHTYG